MKTTALVLSAATLTVLTFVPAMAQQPTGAPGSASATTTIDGNIFRHSHRSSGVKLIWTPGRPDFGLDVVGDDEQRLAGLDDLLQQR
jgi:hypothetical protein